MKRRHGTEGRGAAFTVVTMIGADDCSTAEPTAEPTAELARFDRFFTAAYPSTVRALGDVELGRDAAAEGFARALPRWDRVSAYDNPSGWVYRVGLNWGRSRWRTRRREVGGSHVEERGAAAAMPDPDLVEALCRLSVDHRAVVVGRYYLDWSEAQLAAALDIAPGTVKSRLSRALRVLAELLDDAEEAAAEIGGEMDDAVRGDPTDERDAVMEGDDG